MWRTQDTVTGLSEVRVLATSFTDWEGTCLAHHGIKGQKWGVRRYQNHDGTLTALGKLRGGREARKANRDLKKVLKDNEQYGKEWRKERDKALKRAIKDDNYRKSVAELEARRLGIDPEEFKENYFARDTANATASNVMWYKYGNRYSDNYNKKAEYGEKIAKTVLSKLEKKGYSVDKAGKALQKRWEDEAGIKNTGKSHFDRIPSDSPTKYRQILRDLQDEKDIEKMASKHSKKNKRA